MYYYKAYGLIFESNIEIPQLIEVKKKLPMS